MTGSVQTKPERHGAHAAGPISIRAWPLRLMILLPTLALVLAGWQRRWVSEDAFIDLRVVDNILSGHGPIFNVGERVEAYTNPLWVALLSGWGFLGLPLEIGSVILGLAGTAIGLYAAQHAALQLTRAGYPDRLRTKRHQIVLPLGAIVLLAIPAIWDFSTSGLETGLTFGWLGTSFWLLVRTSLTRKAISVAGERAPALPNHTSVIPSRTPVILSRSEGSPLARLTAAFVFGLGVLIRPDLALFGGAFWLAELLGYGASRGAIRPKHVWPGALASLIAAGALPMAYQIFRMGYFAALVPNTALAKEAGTAYWSQGLIYLWDFVGTYALWLPIVLLLGWQFVAVRRLYQRRAWSLLAVWLAPVVAAALDALYVVRVGGDFMHARFLLPSLFGFLLPLMVVRLPLPARAELRSWVPAVALGLVVAWALVCALWLRVPYAGDVSDHGISDERGFYAGLAHRANPVTADDYVQMPYGADGFWLRSLLEQLDNQRAALATATDTSDSTSARPPSMLVINGFDPKDVPLRADIARRTPLVVVRANLGLAGYLTGPRTRVVDRFGLNDPIGSRLKVAERGRPGHEKGLPNAWVLARFADPAAPLASTPEVDAARAALGCGDLAELLRAVDQPLTTGRFLANLRDAWTLRDLRIPPDPMRAEALLCESP